jgi:hypothetical protein
MGQKPLIFQPGCAITALGPKQNVTCEINRFYTQILVKTSNKMNIKTKILMVIICTYSKKNNYIFLELLN